MKVAIAKAYNGIHKKYNYELKKLGVKTRYFDIDSADWLKNVLKEKVDAYTWQADAKDEDCRIILDRIYFIEKILKKPVFPDLNQYFFYNDKIKQYDFFKYHKIPTPKTFITYKKGKALNFIKKTKYPFILKNIYSYGGKGVYKIDNKKQGQKVVNQIFNKGFEKIKNYLYAQEFIPNLDKDLRIITIGKRAKFAYWRIGSDNWKHNIGQGGSVNLEKIPKKAIRLCEKISKKNRFHWMSYDAFLLKNGKIKISEFSCNFSTEGIEKEGIKVRKEMMKYLIKKIR